MVTLPLGDGETEVELPDCEVDVAVPSGVEAVDPRRAAGRALAAPRGPPLRERAATGDEVCLVVTDVTRATPGEVLVDAVLEELAAAGVDRGDVTVLVGLGLHRPMTDDELRDGLGEHADLAVNHDPDATVRIGSVPFPGPDTAGGEGGADPDPIPIELHERAAAADLLVSTGLVEPHQYAGFSGGAKTAVVGAGGEPLIRATHGPAMLAREGVRLGRIDDNPFRATIDRAGDVAGVEFCLNVTRGPSGLLDAAAGDPRAVVADLAASAREALAVEVAGGYDAVLAGVGAPKDANLYQASRAFTYVVLGAHDPLAPGGRVVVPARLSEGAGTGVGERRFRDRLAGAESPAALYREMREGYEPGAQRAFVVARALREHDCVVTDTESPEVVAACLMTARPSVRSAVEPGCRVLAVPDALNTLLY